MINQSSKLIILPNTLSDEQDPRFYLPPAVFDIVKQLDGLIAESEKEARRFLKHFELKKPLQQMPITLLNEHTKEQELDPLIQPILKGEIWGLVSDAGMPCLADPGAKLVSLARKRSIQVETVIGPTSILQALLLSGLPSQQFAFHGYLERDPDSLKKQLRTLEKQAHSSQSTQIFIEAPYRNQKTLQTLIETLNSQTVLAVACDLTLSSQQVIVEPISIWKNKDLSIFQKRPAVFLFITS